MSNTSIPDAARDLAAATDAIDYSEFRVRPEYIDANGHMNVGYYSVIFDKASDVPIALLGGGPEMMERHRKTSFALESHVTFQREILLEHPLAFGFLLLDYDSRRLHFIMTMRHAAEGWVAATFESISMCIDLATRRATSWPADRLERTALLHAVHRTRPRPAEVGRVIGIRRKAG